MIESHVNSVKNDEIEADFCFENRIVVFLDVLGFREKLEKFEKEAHESLENNDRSNFLCSVSVNNFIETFRDSIEVLKKVYQDELQYYLFSDNMCLSISYLNNPNILIDILFSICDLFKSFAHQGYFLRGAIDYGLFIDKAFLAVGTPLSNAYELESKKAIYPRFLISEKYMNKIFDCIKEKSFNDASLSNYNLLVKKSCELNYLNIFGSIITIGDLDSKFEFLQKYFQIINDCLEENKSNETVFHKYVRLKLDLKLFIDEYLNNLSEYEPDLDLDGEKYLMKQIGGLLDE